MRIAAGIEYCGTPYMGWQRQAHGETVQEHLERALSRVADQPIQVNCAGRTDAGVHALHQVVHFDCSAERKEEAWTLGTRTHLPDSIGVIWACSVADTFHARFSARSRTYHYVILNRAARPGLWHGFVSWECRQLDQEQMSVAAQDLLGRHDFTSFRGQGCQAKTAIREIRRLDVRRNGDLVIIVVEANAFLQHMVRNIAGVLIGIGLGTRPVGWAAEVLAARARTAGGVTAPASGLYLTQVRYAPEYNIPPREFAASCLFPFVDTAAQDATPPATIEGPETEDFEN